MNIDRRHSQRFVCAGSAELFESPESASLPAQITNLSLHGCRVRLHDPKQVHLGHTVEISFAVYQEPFRVRAEVKSISEESELGLLFLAPSARTKVRLTDLIELLNEQRLRLRPQHGDPRGKSA